MLLRSIIHLFIFTACVCSGTRVDKYWVKNWDLDTVSNWKDNRLPCAGKKASLPLYPSNMLFVGGDLTLASLELPIDGEVIMGAGANMVFDSTASQQCNDAEWSRQGEDKWWDPDGWEYPGYKDTSYTIPVPDLHRPPCTRDAAVFPDPTKSLFTLTLASPTVYVTRISVGNTNYSTSEFAAYTNTKEGRSRFKGASYLSGRGPLYVESPGECTDMTGCLCGTEGAAATICRIKAAKCPTPRCDKPMDMTGFCCPVCGAEVTISHNSTMPLSSVANLLATHESSQVMQGVKAYLAKMSDQNYHVYFTAMTEGGDYSAASKDFKDKFNKELNKGGKHQALVSSSSNLLPLPSTGVAPHNIAATLITLFICLFIGAAIFYLRKRKVRPDLSFMFRRLEGNSRRVSVVSDVMGGRRPSNASGILAYSRESGLRFFNPIFNQSMASLSGAGLSSVINENAPPPSSSSGEGQHENPVYAAYQDMSPEEQQASEESLKARERILEAAEHIVASIEDSQVHYKGRKLSSQPENDLEVITEEKDTKQDTGNFQLILEDNGPNESSTDPTTDALSGQEGGDTTNDSAQEALVPSEATTEDNNHTIIPIADLTDAEAPVDERKKNVEDVNTSTTPEALSNQEKTTETSMQEKTTEASSEQEKPSEMDALDAFFSNAPERKDSSSTSSSDDDALSAMKNLEGFSPLVDLKFKK